MHLLIDRCVSLTPVTCVSGARNSHEAALYPLLCHHTLLSPPFCKESWNGSRPDCPREMGGGQQGRWNQCWHSFESHPSPSCCLRQVCQVTTPAVTACRGQQEVDGLTLCLLLTPALPFLSLEPPLVMAAPDCVHSRQLNPCFSM